MVCWETTGQGQWPVTPASPAFRPPPSGNPAKKEKATGTMPIIAMTAHAMKGDQEICLQAGMDGYITKPIQPSRLFQTIEEIASAHSAAAV